MTDLRAQPEKKRDSLKIEFAEEMQRKLMEFDENQIAMTNWPNVYARGATAMLSLLWPVIEAADHKWMPTYASRTGRGEIGEADREVFRAIDEALTELRRRVGEGKDE